MVNVIPGNRGRKGEREGTLVKNRVKMWRPPVKYDLSGFWGGSLGKVFQSQKKRKGGIKRERRSRKMTSRFIVETKEEKRGIGRVGWSESGFW